VSAPRQPRPAKLIASIISGEAALTDEITGCLSRQYGRIEYTSQPLAFNYTNYYAGEIGQELVRRFIAFDDLIEPERLPDIKLFTNGLEAAYSRPDGTRRVNIDPGYITLHHLILATCKNFAHRPYLRDGVFADLTLLYKGGSFTPLAWTFPDYRTPELIGLLNGIRNSYYQQLKKERG
jgi:hypothetical protein